MEEKKTYQKEYEFGFNDGNEYLLNEKKVLTKISLEKFQN